MRNFLYLFSLLVLFLPGGVRAEGADKDLKTRYASVAYAEEADLIDFGKKIGGSTIALTRDREKTLALVKEDVDRIVFRVKMLLDMHPPELSFNVNINKNYGELRRIYSEMGLNSDPPIAFYSHRTRTVYVSLERLTDGVFAHEVAHAVINQYFSTPPPAQMQEILAQYVDKHLNENK